jgi:hypothetical protein
MLHIENPMKLVFVILAVVWTNGCAQQDDISVYKVPKEDHQPAVASAPSGSSSSVAWDVPADWKEKPASGMRLASFGTSAGGEVSIVALPGEAGGDLANINRWRGQLGLGPIDAQALTTAARSVSSPAGDLLVVDFSSPSKGRMLGARLISGGKTWFFKLTGTASAVASSLPSYEKFLSGLRPAEGAASSADTAAMPETPMTPMPGMDAPAVSGKGLHWTAPKGWQEKPATGMRLATFLVPVKDGKSAEVSVVALPGDAGGDLANVNRWRGQLGLGEIDAQGLKDQSRRLSSPAGDVLLVDFKNPGKGRMVAARLFTGGQSWFFKMTGEEAVVASAKTGFVGFLGTLRHEAE